MTAEKLNEMFASLQKQGEEAASGSKEAWNSMVKTAQKNYEEMQKMAAASSADMVSKMKKMNDDLIAKLKKSYEGTKGKLSTDYKDWSSKKTSEIESGWADFKKKLVDSLSKVSDESSKMYKDTIDKVNSWNPKGKSKSDIDKFYNDSVESMDKNFNEAISKLKFESK